MAGIPGMGGIAAGELDDHRVNLAAKTHSIIGRKIREYKPGRRAAELEEAVIETIRQIWSNGSSPEREAPVRSR